MIDFEYKAFASKTDFPHNPSNNDIITTSMQEFKRESVELGSFKGYTLSPRGISFYESIPELALIDSANYWSKSDDYASAEPSIKVSISFLLGMILTRIIAKRVYNLPAIFHLKDSIAVSFSTSGRIPDFVGFNSNGDAYLFEAKGTNMKYTGDISSAKGQLQAISLVSSVISKQTRSANIISRHVIVSQFENNRLICLDIDPEPNIELTIDLDLATLESLAGIVNIMKREGNRVLNLDKFELRISEDLFKRLSLLVDKLNEKKMQFTKSVEEIEKNKKLDRKNKDEKIKVSKNNILKEFEDIPNFREHLNGLYEYIIVENTDMISFKEMK